MNRIAVNEKKPHFIIEFRNKVHVYDNNREEKYDFSYHEHELDLRQEEDTCCWLFRFILKVIYRNFFFSTCESARFFRKPTSSSSTWLTYFIKLILFDFILQQEIIELTNPLRDFFYNQLALDCMSHNIQQWEESL